MTDALTILFVVDPARARSFWSAALGTAPRLDVPGMTEYDLPGGGGLGLMPRRGIHRLLGAGLPADAVADPGPEAIPRAELYLRVADPEARLAAALAAGAQPVASVAPRDWGDRAGYCLDPDGHLLAFAAPIARPPARPMPADAQPVALDAAFAGIDAPWSPRVAAALNGQHLRVARLHGAFHWHRHDEEDELFLVRRGTLEIEFRDRTIRLEPGMLLVVPRGVEHRPVAREEVEVQLFEPATTVSTGGAGDAPSA